MQRINSFLLRGEEIEGEQHDDFQKQDSGHATVRFKDCKFAWTKSSSGSAFSLRIDDLSIPAKRLTLVGGDVASGKSAFLCASPKARGYNSLTDLADAILSEMSKVEGTLELPPRTKISYAAQSPFLQNDTIRNNIMFGQAYDESRYKRTLSECALDDDLKVLANGDDTVVGERGFSLSGGQQARYGLLPLSPDTPIRCTGYR